MWQYRYTERSEIIIITRFMASESLQGGQDNGYHDNQWD